MLGTQKRTDKTSEQKVLDQQLVQLADRYNELTYENQPDPAESNKEFFKCVGILSLVFVVVYVLFLVCILLIFS